MRVGRVLHKIWLPLISLAITTACQMAPTRVSESSQRSAEPSVVLDVRSAFDYGLNRVEGSLHFPWESLAESAHSGELLRDQRKAGLRLSLLGVDKASSVLVVGNGPARGSGEEGRLAWNLLYLGFKDVQVASIDNFKNLLTQRPTPPPANGTVWVPEPKSDLLISKSDFLSLMKDKKAKGAHIIVIDVRSRKEFSDRRVLSDAGVINIEWSKFYKPDGRPNQDFKQILTEWGINPKDRIVVISNRGVRSAAAAFALLSLGYTQVQNFTGGYRSI